MRKSVLALLAVISSFIALGNAAMPGMWSAGHGGRFIPLFREDSIHFGKIQMQKERVLVNLFPGFAAVKGEYWMYNTTGEAITLRVGYPINGRYDADLVENVMFEDLYRLQAKVNEQSVAITKAANYDTAHRGFDHMQANNWYFFTCTFAPKQLTKITVYFLTNNSESQLGQGYGRDKGNAFAYILESGRAWAGKIEKGEVLIQLNDGLTLDDFRGVYPVKTLVGDDKRLKFSFLRLEPDSSDNILLWYTPEMPGNFDFQAIAARADDYYQQLNAFPIVEFYGSDMKIIDKDDFDVRDSGLGWLWGFIIGIVVVGLLVIAGVIYLIYRLVKWSKRR